MSFQIWTPGKFVYCPLCKEPFKTMGAIYQGRQIEVYFCREDKIFTFPFDPAFNKWFDTDKTIPCSNCSNKSVRWFLRHLDDYFKTVCIDCGVGVETDARATFNEKGLIELDEFIENQPTETIINIPLKRLKVTSDQLARYRAKKENNGQT
jgi:hypothetical protein